MEAKYEIDTKHIYGLEFVKGEMEIYIHKQQVKNYENKIFDKEYPEVQKKINIVTAAQNNIYELIAELNRVSKLNYQQKLLIDKLTAENIMLNNKH